MQHTVSIVLCCMYTNNIGTSSVASFFLSYLIIILVLSRLGSDVILLSDSDSELGFSH